MKIALKALIFLGVVLCLALLMLIPGVSNAVAAPLKTTGAKIRSIAETVAGITISLILITIGILSAGSGLALLGGIMVIAGLGVGAWNIIPFFTSKPQMSGSVKVGN